MTILYVTHDQEEALVMSDRICLMNGGRIEQLGTGRDLYFQPRTVFAANFLGQSNILPAEIDRSGPTPTIRTAGGLRLASAAFDGSAPMSHVMIRPENLRLLPPGELADDAVPGVVDEVVFTGGTIRLLVRIADDLVLAVTRLTTSDDLTLKPGAPVRVGWDSTCIVPLIGTI